MTKQLKRDLKLIKDLGKLKMQKEVDCLPFCQFLC